MAKQYKNILILTGAGISAESGLSTFRAEMAYGTNIGWKMSPLLKHLNAIQNMCMIFITSCVPSFIKPNQTLLIWQLPSCSKTILRKSM